MSLIVQANHYEVIKFVSLYEPFPSAFVKKNLFVSFLVYSRETDIDSWMWIEFVVSTC